jgi:hypothetical protein
VLRPWVMVEAVAAFGLLLILLDERFDPLLRERMVRPGARAALLPYPVSSYQFPRCLLLVCQCTRTHSPHPPPCPYTSACAGSTARTFHAATWSACEMAIGHNDVVDGVIPGHIAG